MLIHLLLLVTLNIFASPNSSEDEAARQLFLQGIKTYQNNYYDQAIHDFEKSLELIPHNPTILFNWGLSEMKRKNFGIAIAAWRKAITIAPDFQPAHQALKFASSQAPQQTFSYSNNSWETFRNSFLRQFSLNNLLFLTLLFAVSSGFLLIKYWSKRSLALREERPLPKFPTVGSLLFVGFLFFSFSVITKIIDSLRPRATVVAEKASLYTGPNREDTVLFEIFSGHEVVVLNKMNNWAQIKIPGGPTGWVPEENLFLTSGSL